MHNDSHGLADKELDRLEELLSRSDSEYAMNLEQVDGFFAALVCGPEIVLPSEYLPEIWGLESDDAAAPFDNIQELGECLDLLLRHWNNIAETLSSGEMFLPVLLQDDDVLAHANDWAQGFMLGIGMRSEAWQELFDDQEHQGLLLAILILANEHNPDPKMRPYQKPVSTELREELIAGAAASVKFIDDYFAPHRRTAAMAHDAIPGRAKQSKIGRNEPCPCGSGKKYKRCCGQTAIH